jgi:hypothetical protein
MESGVIHLARKHKRRVEEEGIKSRLRHAECDYQMNMPLCPGGSWIQKSRLRRDALTGYNI